MSVQTKYTPYDYVITVGDEESWAELSVSKVKGGYPLANIATSCCKFSTINVPLTLFADIDVEGLERNYYYHPELEETTTIFSCDGAWELRQSWSGETCIACIVITESDMKDLVKMCLSLCRKNFK